MTLKPFWRYYGGKWRAAPRYPKPRHDTIIEPFAGAAGYSLRYPDRRVVLLERYPIVAGIWRYLISVSAAEVRRIPPVDSVDDLPGWVPQEGRWLVGFHMNAATVSPRRTLSSGRRKLHEQGRTSEGWTVQTRERIERQVEGIRHWKIIEGDWSSAPAIKATWFVDPPYSNRTGSYYVHSDIDYPRLAEGCGAMPGQVIVCENEGATWLPFEPFGTFKEGLNKLGEGGSREVVALLDNAHPYDVGTLADTIFIQRCLT